VLLKLINFATLCAVIGYTISFFHSPFDGYAFYLIMIGLYPVLIAILVMEGRLTLNVGFLAGVVILGTINLYSISSGYNTIGGFVKVAVSLLFVISFYYFILAVNHFKVEPLFRMYMTFAKVIAVVGIVQFCSYGVGFLPGYDYGWLLNEWKVVAPTGKYIRINSLLPEPAHLAQFMAPASFMAIARLVGIGKGWLSSMSAVAIILVIILSTSSLGFLCLFAGLLLFVFNLRKLSLLFIGLIAGIGAFIGAYTFDEGFELRVNSSVAALVYGDLAAKNSDLSTFTILNNGFVAYNVVRRRPLTGGGLGSHPLSFEKYTLTREDGFFSQALNTKDANSMFIRLASETGIVGLSMMFGLLFFCFLRRPLSGLTDHWLIQNSIFLLMMIVLFRQGHYFVCGTPLFLWMYYYNYRANLPRSIPLNE
jgi:hypothetical protein